MTRYQRNMIGAIAGLVVALASIHSAAGGGIRHTVVAGDTLSYIAHIYSVTVGELVQSNAISDPNFIYPGQVLEVPGSHSGGAGGGMDGPPGSYEVQPGDTLGHLAERFGVSVTALKAANGLTSDLILVGQQMSIPSASSGLPVVNLVPPSAPQTEALLEDFAHAEGLDPGLVKAIALVESGWNQGAVSPAGAIGIMQLMPGTAAWLQTDIFGYALNYDTSAFDNIKAGTRFLRILLDATGDLELAVASYYQGLGATQSGIMYEDTRDYVRLVLAVRQTFWP